MKKVFIFIGAVFIILVLFLIWKIQNNRPKEIQEQVISTQKLMQITSPNFLNNQNIPVKYTCDGDGINPALEFTDVPKEALSLALVVDDPDAPNQTWVHWVMWNMSPQTLSINENSFPEEAIVGKASSGQNNYGGPCPPSGTHRYFFKLFALDTKLKLASYSSSDDLQKAMQGHILSQAQIIGLYSRNK